MLNKISIANILTIVQRKVCNTSHVVAQWKASTLVSDQPSVSWSSQHLHTTISWIKLFHILWIESNQAFTFLFLTRVPLLMHHFPQIITFPRESIHLANINNTRHPFHYILHPAKRSESRGRVFQFASTNFNLKGRHLRLHVIHAADILHPGGFFCLIFRQRPTALQKHNPEFILPF